MSVIDIPEKGTLIGSILIEKDFLFFVCGTTLYVSNINNPKNIIQTKELEKVAVFSSILFANNRLYVTAEETLHIFEIDLKSE
jgi:hypothetical protein